MAIIMIVRDINASTVLTINPFAFTTHSVHLVSRHYSCPFLRLYLVLCRKKTGVWTSKTVEKSNNFIRAWVIALCISFHSFLRSFLNVKDVPSSLFSTHIRRYTSNSYIAWLPILILGAMENFWVVRKEMLNWVPFQRDSITYITIYYYVLSLSYRYVFYFIVSCW